MSKREIIIEADENGQTTITVEGITGPGCKDLTKKFEEALGTVKSETLKKEFYEKPLKAALKVKQ